MMIPRNGKDADTIAAELADALARGRTVYVTTSTHRFTITPRNARRWADSGRPVLKASNGSLWMASGRRYVCIDYAGIAVR